MSPDRWQRIEQLYHEALERPVAERAAWLTQACADDEALRGEVARLLGANDAASGFLDAPALQAQARAWAKDIPETSLAGQAFSHYKILSKLGAGGMGEVYLARDLALERQVAVKVLPAAFTRDADRVQRFEREAKAASALNHPNIVTIHEIGQVPLAEGPTQFIVIEYIEGHTLRDRLAQGALPVSAALDFTAQVAGALAAAHAAGIVHRDIKPENVMVRRDGLVKVLDFGLAKVLKTPAVQTSGEVDAEAPTQQMVKTQSGIILGTLNYLSPEQARGKDVDARTDIFSLGILLYELVTATRPFTGETVSDLIAAILKTEPPPLADNAPKELQAIINRALQKAPDARYQSAQAMLEDLKRLKQRLDYEAEWSETATLAAVKTDESQVVRSDAQTDGSRVLQTTALSGESARPVQHYRWAVAALLVLLFSVTGVLGYFVYQRYAVEEEIDSIAVLPLLNIEGQQELDYLADGLTEGLINNLSQVPKLKVMSRNAVFRYKGKDVDVDEIKQRFKVRAMLTGRLMRQGDQYVVKLELIDTADNRQLWSLDKPYQLTALQSQITQDVAVKLRARLTDAEKQQISKPLTEDAQAYQHYLRGRHHWNIYTEEALKSGIAEFELALRRDPKFAAAEAGLALCYIGLATNYGSPGINLRLAKQHAQAAARLDDKLDDAHYALGRVYMFYDWDWRRAGEEFQRTLELNPNHALTYQAYSVLAQTFRNFNDDLKHSRQALEYDPVSLPINLNLGLSYYFAEQYEKALEQIQVSEGLEPVSFFPPFYKARIYVEQGKYEEAIQQIQIALPRSKQNAVVRATLGYVYARAGQSTEARKLAAKLAGESAATYVPPTFLAMIYAALNDKDEAFRWLDKAAQEHSPWLLKINVEPAFKQLRKEAKFTALLKRMGLDSLKNIKLPLPLERLPQRQALEFRLARYKA